MYNGLRAAYPDITFISTAYNENSGYNISIPAGNTWVRVFPVKYISPKKANSLFQDLHHYETPTFSLENFDFFDNWQERTGNPDVTIFIGEYSVYQIDTPRWQCLMPPYACSRSADQALQRYCGLLEPCGSAYSLPAAAVSYRRVGLLNRCRT